MMQGGLHVNVSAVDYDATSRSITTVLNRMQTTIHEEDQFSITDSEFAFGWHFFVVTVNAEAVEKLASVLGEEFEQLKGKGQAKKFLTWMEKRMGDGGPRFRLAIKEEMESSKFGIF